MFAQTKDSVSKNTMEPYGTTITASQSDDEIIITDKNAPKGEEIFTIVEKMPSFPGGDTKMAEFIQKNIGYPKEELNKGIFGTCYITFIVDKTGEIKDVKVLRGIKDGNLCNSEAVSVVEKMPKWIPGENNGQKVNVQYNLPIKFLPKK